MAKMLLRHPALVWGLLLMVMSHSAVARVQIKGVKEEFCKHDYQCEDVGAVLHPCE